MLSLTEHERAVKRKLIDASNTIRKKIRGFLSGVNVDEQNFRNTSKPIIEPLTEVVNVVKQQNSPSSNLEAGRLLKENALLKQTIQAQRKELHVLNQKLEALLNTKHDYDKRFFFVTSPKQEALVKQKTEPQSGTLHAFKQKVEPPVSKHEDEDDSYDNNGYDDEEYDAGDSRFFDTTHRSKQEPQRESSVSKDEHEEDRFYEAKDEGIYSKAFEYLKDLSETPQHFDTQYE